MTNDKFEMENGKCILLPPASCLPAGDARLAPLVECDYDSLLEHPNTW